MLITALALHMLASVLWMGGLFFALVVLRPALDGLSEDERRRLWGRLLPRAFAVAWICVVILLVTGYGVLYFGYEGLAGAGTHVRIMEWLGLVMFLMFGWMYFRPFRQFMQALAEDDRQRQAVEMVRLKGANGLILALGLIVLALAATGNFWG